MRSRLWAWTMTVNLQTIQVACADLKDDGVNAIPHREPWIVGSSAAAMASTVRDSAATSCVRVS